MNDLQKELQALKEKVADLESRIVAEPLKWQPKGGQYYVECLSSTNVFDRETKEQAERAAVEMRRFNRLLALRDELCGDVVVNWTDNESNKWILYFDNKDNEWTTGKNQYMQYVGIYFANEASAQKACDMLNSGEVEL